MFRLLDDDAVRAYRESGFYKPLRVFSSDEAQRAVYYHGASSAGAAG